MMARGPGLALALLLAPGCHDYDLESYQPVLSVAPETLSFEDVPFGSSMTLHATVTNAGDGRAVMQGAQVGEPFFSEGPVGSLEPGSVMSFEIVFRATDTEPAQGVLTVVSDDAPPTGLHVALEATVALPDIAVSPQTLTFELNFDEQQLETTVSNTGGAPLELIAVELADDGGGLFSLPSTTEGLTLDPGAEVALPVSFEGTAAAMGTLLVSSDDPDEPSVEVALTTLDLAATITAPSDGDLLGEGVTHYLYGSVTSPGDPDTLSWRWHSSIDGDLGAGSYAPPSDLVNAVDLSQGCHELSLQVETAWGGQASDQIGVCVNAGPSATITWPADGTWKLQGNPFPFDGLVDDPDDDPRDLWTRWSSSLDGTLDELAADEQGLTRTVTDALTPGRHSITLTVEDPDGGQASDTIDVVVVDCSDKEDRDGDGWSASQGDCDDDDADVYPGQTLDLGDTAGACWGGSVVTITGEGAGDSFGFAFGDPGDLDGDGLPDVMIGAKERGDGEAYLLMGRDRGWIPHVGAGSLPSIYADTAASKLGHNVTVVQDFDGDGLDEALASSHEDEGSSWVFFGRSSWTDLPMTAADIDFHAPSGTDNGGEDVTSADFDGDGYGDLVISGCGYDDWTGRCWLFRGGLGTAGTVDMEDAEVILSGPDEVGRFANAVSQVGDTDGDGLPDLLLSAERSDFSGTDAGAVFLYTELDTAAGHLGDDAWTAEWWGETAGDKLGTHDMVAWAGDVDADGLSDFLFIASGFDTSTDEDAGKVYLVHGSEQLEGRIDPADADHSWVGDGGGDLDGANGEGLAPAGDVDGDGLPDFLVGADDDDSAHDNAGRCYLYLGRSRSDWGHELPLTTADRMFYGVRPDAHAGRALYGVGDMDDNGNDDFVVGAYEQDQGVAYLYLNDYGSCPD